jgi:hypothetical protein
LKVVIVGNGLLDLTTFCNDAVVTHDLLAFDETHGL